MATFLWRAQQYSRDTSPASAGTPFKAVSIDSSHSCGLRTDDTVTCWGSSEYGEADPPGGTFAAVDVNIWNSCGLRPGGAIVCWGRHAFRTAGP